MKRIFTAFFITLCAATIISSCQSNESTSSNEESANDVESKNEPKEKVTLTMPGAVPPDGTRLLFIGQDLDAIAGYVQSGKFPIPAGTVTYAYPMDSAAGLLPTRSSWGSGDLCMEENVKTYPNSLIALGVSIVEKDENHESLNKLVEGAYDKELEILANNIKFANRPVYVRIGYEFDGMWNHYDPEEYKAAFKYIYNKVKPIAGANFVTVWQACTSPVNVILDSVVNKIYNKTIYPWYPGDEYVDWMGYSWFLNDEMQHKLTDEVCNFARKKGKPVMLSESSAQSYQFDDLTKRNIGGLYDGYPGDDTTKVTSAEIWEKWFVPYFNYIEKNADVIKAVHYINCDWDSQFVWGRENVAAHAPRGYAEGYWGDTRLEINEELGKKWLEKVSEEGWLMAHDFEMPTK